MCSKGADYEGYSAAITRCSFGGDVIDALDMNDVTQLMETMGISTQHRLLLKATFTGWKKSPGAAFEALASAKVAHVQHMAPLQLCDVRLQAAAADKALQEAAAAKKKQEEAAAAQKKAQVQAAAPKKKKAAAPKKPAKKTASKTPAKKAFTKQATGVAPKSKTTTTTTAIDGEAIWNVFQNDSANISATVNGKVIYANDIVTSSLKQRVLSWFKR